MICTTPSHVHSRRGVTLIIVLISVTIAAAICVKLTQAAFQQVARQQLELWDVQAEVFVNAALDRAVAQVALDPDYRSETWRPTVGSAGIGAVRAEITITPKESQNVTTIHVKCFVPDDITHRIQKTRVVTLPQ